MSTEVAHAPAMGGKVAAIVPQTIEDLKWVAGMIIDGGLAPSGYNNDRKKIALGIMKGAEIGLPPLTALSTIAIVNGRPSLWGDGAIALVQKSGLIVSFEERMEGTPDGEDWRAVCIIKRKGQEAPYHREFSVADAKRAKLWNKPGPWIQYPQRMLQMRARSWALRDGFADCLMGLAIAEEAQDMPPPVPVATDTAFLDDDAPALVGEVLPPIKQTDAA